MSGQLFQWLSTKRTACFNGRKEATSHAVPADKMPVITGFATFHTFLLAAVITNSLHFFTPPFFAPP